MMSMSSFGVAMPRLLFFWKQCARRVLGQLLKDQLLVSDNPKGPVSFNFPLDVLSILLPNLYPEAATTNTEP